MLAFIEAISYIWGKVLYLFAKLQLDLTFGMPILFGVPMKWEH